MLIEVVSHCWAVKLPHYAALLDFQLSSFYIQPPTTCEVQATVCCTHADARTREVVEFFKDKVNVKTLLLKDEHELGRRAIGRNQAAKCSKADIVWFADVDQVYQDGCLDRLAAMAWPDKASIIFPTMIKIHKDHATGDDYATNPCRQFPAIFSIDPEDFVDKRYFRAIGGAQIVRGDFARAHGYLDGSARFQAPAVKPFGDFKDDLEFRRACNHHGPIVGVSLPGMYRLRHSKTSYR